MYISTGTTESLECSGHGVCDYSKGLCTCYGLYSSSDGFGSPGVRMDCGYRYQLTANYTQTHTNDTFNKINYNITGDFNTSVVAYCPFIKNGVCAGNGVCNNETGSCQCHQGSIK